MRKRRLFRIGSIALAGFSFILCVSAAVKQVRVITDRASIYVEPSRSSARLETVEKGTLLNLFQERKVRDVWYYVSFQSKRYGGRISGFIHESAVEPVVEEKLPVAKKEEALPLPPIKEEEKKEAQETLVATRLPQGKRIKLPRQIPQLKDTTWKPVLPEPVQAPPSPKEVEPEEPKLIIPIEIIISTPIARPRIIPSPRRDKAWEDAAWRIIPLLPAEKKVKVEKPPPSPPPPAKKEETKEKPQVVVPVKTPAPPPTPAPLPRRQYRPRERGLLTIGFGYGPSLGGAGGLIQLNTGIGFSIHAGLGIYPTTIIYSETDWVKNELLYSVGVKYYLPFKTSSIFPYLDLQYGGIKVEAAQMVLGIWDFKYVLGQEQKALQGISTLVGAELRRGRFGLNSALGLGYILTDWKYLSQRLSFGFDLGILIYF